MLPPYAYSQKQKILLHITTLAISHFFCYTPRLLLNRQVITVRKLNSRDFHTIAISGSFVRRGCFPDVQQLFVIDLLSVSHAMRHILCWKERDMSDHDIEVLMLLLITHGSIIFGRNFHICGTHQAMTHSFSREIRTIVSQKNTLIPLEH